MKKQFFSLLCATALLPAFSAVAATGSGTAADPYKIATAADLCDMHTLVKAGQMTYFVQTADIDMSTVKNYTAPVGSDGASYNFPMYYDGGFHVISNFAPENKSWGNPNCYAQSVFGVFSGELKNLGIVDINIGADGGRAGAIGGYLGQSSAGVPVTKVSNVYVTGKVKGGSASYTGGLFGTTGTDVEITNCYVNIEMEGAAGGLNGLFAGRINNPAKITNCYVAGNVTGNANLVCAANTGATTLDGFVVFATGSETLGLTDATGATLANTDETMFSGIEMVESWAAYDIAAGGFPEFKWQNAADDEALRMIWLTPQHPHYNGTWGTGDNPRFATAYNGKMYTVDQKNTYIAEITAQGIKDLYKLAATPDKNLYGTPISVDEAGNFLLGTNFTKAESLTKFAVYVTATGEIKNFTIPAPQATKLGRLDCLGRVIGDLTKEAYFFITPDQSPNYTDDSSVRIIRVKGDGTVPTEMTQVSAVEVAQSNCRQGVAQPAFHTLAEAQAADAVKDFYYSSCAAKSYYASYIGGVLTSDFAKDMLYTTVAANNGFDTFVVGGKRYFVRNYADAAGQSPMSFVVMDENGDALVTWTNEEFVQDGGYSTIVTEPQPNGTVNIYIYNSANTKGGAAAMFNFDPAKAGEPVKPYIPTGDTVDNPYKISTPQDLLDLAAKRVYVPFYVTLENDIDMSGMTLTTINVQGNAVHFDGKNHIIKNLTVTNSGGTCALFDYFIGSIKNLGLENINAIGAEGWGVTGTMIGYVGNKQGGETVIENCFATGVAGSASYYGGGLVGGVNDNSSLTVRNCYTNVDVAATYKYAAAGGLVGPANASTTVLVENCYVAGSVLSSGVAGAVVYGTTFDNASVTVKNVVALNKAFTGQTQAGLATAPIVGYGAGVQVTDAYAWEGIAGVKDGKTTAELQAIVTSWEAFNDKLNDGYPVLAWQEANGESEIVIYGTKEHPHKISTPEDLASWGEKMLAGDVYFSIENDIDMEGVEYTVPLQGDNFLGRYVHIEGNKHVIKNLTANASEANGYGGLIGILMGEVHNLGLENVSVKAWCAGGLAGMVGNGNYNDNVTVVDNCFVTGTVTGTGGYAGALGATSGNLTVTNSYTNVAVSGNNGFGNSGFLTSYYFAPKTVTIENVYVAGPVSGGVSVGIFNSANPNVTPTVKINNAVVLSPTIDGSTSATAISAIGTIENTFVSAETLVNGAAVDGAKPAADLIATVTSWEAFNDKTKDGMPVLAWQEADLTPSGIDDIEVEGSDVAPVYYNLQGVQVANPENGIYIVRRGNKVSKEYIR